MKSSVQKVADLAKRLGWAKIVAGVGVIVAIAVGANAIFGGGAQEQVFPSVRAVQVRSVAELASETSPLSIVGEVSSKSEATVRAESSGRVTGVYRNLGDSVGAGQIVAELEAASQRAALLQAQGTEAAAQAALDKVKKGTRSEQLDILKTAYEGAQSGAINALLSAYTSVDSALRGTTDAFFSNPTSVNPNFGPVTTNANLETSAEAQRVALGLVLDRQKSRATSLSASDDLNGEITTTLNELRAVRDYLDAVITALNAAVATDNYSATTIATYLTSATAARGTINTALSSVTSARQTLGTAKSNLDQGVTGSQPEDVAAAEATLMQAKGAVAAARANLEKAIIRAPISGTINSFSLKQGDYVSAGSEVLTVANNRALEVVAYITEQDAKEIAVGQKVTFDNGAAGTVTRIAPALDPVTKKIEVRIGVEGNASLVNGQSTLAQIERVHPKMATGSRITIPIAAIKVESDRVSVFTVGEGSALEGHEVVLGALLGDRVEIVSGLTSDMSIVTDARGLREGQTVEIQ